MSWALLFPLKKVLSWLVLRYSCLAPPPPPPPRLHDDSRGAEFYSVEIPGSSSFLVGRRIWIPGAQNVLLPLACQRNDAPCSMSEHVTTACAFQFAPRLCTKTLHLSVHPDVYDGSQSAGSADSTDNFLYLMGNTILLVCCTALAGHLDNFLYLTIILHHFKQPT